jgi:tetratricopeptide (TPR) repeat protein
VKTLKLIACASLAVVWATSATAAEPRIGKYVKYDAGEYVIVTSRSSSQARRIIEDLASFRGTLERVLGKRAIKNTAPTIIVISSTTDWRNWLQPRQNVGGFFQRGRFSNYMAMNGDWPLEETLHIAFHEFTHYYLASQFAGEYPPWFNEGMAELMGYVKFDKGQAILRIPMAQVSEARDSDWISFDRLIRVRQSDPEYQSHKLGPAFYAQSWLTVHYGMVENREFGKQIFEYLMQLNTLVPQEEAARKIFGADLSGIDNQLRTYARSKTMMSGAVSLGDMPPVTLAEGVPLSDADTLEILADLMIGTRFPPDHIRPLVESLQRREPNSARPAILAARVAQIADDNAAFEAAVVKAEGALAPGDWLQRRELATVLLTSADNANPMSTRKSEDTHRDTARALKWFAEAIQHNNSDVEALWGFGTAATRLNKNLDLAEQALVSAYQRAPWNADIAMSLANLKAQQQKPDEMIPFLEDVIRLSTNLGMRSWAADNLLETRKYLEERDKVEAENQKRREDYEKQVAEWEKKYGKKKGVKK